MSNYNKYLFFRNGFRGNRTLKIALKTILIFFVIAVFAPLLANDRPLFCQYKGNWLFPAFSFKNKFAVSVTETIDYNMGEDWKNFNAQVIIFSLCAYSPKTMDAVNAPRKSPFEKQFLLTKNTELTSIPFRFRHWLGTTQNGNDIFSNLIFGCRIALFVGIFSMAIAALVGVFLGCISGYFQNHKIKAGLFEMMFLSIAVFFVLFFWLVVNSNASNFPIIFNFLKVGGTLLFIFCFVYSGRMTDKLFGIEKRFSFPVDSLISKSIEVLNSIPALLLIIVMASLAKPSYTLLVLIIGLLSWTSFARITRTQILKEKQLDYVLACNALGFSDFKIIVKHILPNILPVIYVQLAFGIAGAVLAEASLSFIGVGVPINSASWGNLLNEGRDNFNAWWLIVFPGLCLLTLIFSYNTIAKELSRKNVGENVSLQKNEI